MRNFITLLILISTFILTITFEGYAQNWEEREPIPTPRALSTTSVLDGKIYVIGGTTTPFGVATKIVEVYDPSTDTWETNVPDLPEPLLRASSGVIDGKIYVTGGHHENVHGDALSTVYQFDPADGGTWTTKANMLKPRFYHETEVIDNKMYVMAGRSLDAPGPVDNTVEMYDPVTNTWVFKSSMNRVRGGFTSEVIDGNIYVMGGAHFDTLFSEVEVYDPSTDIWTEIEDMPKVRCWHGSGIVGDYVYVFGGATSVNLVGQPITETWKYDPMVDWTNIQIDLPEVTSAFAYASAIDENENQCLYAISGATLEFWFPTGGPYVTGKNFKLCPDVTSTENLEKATAVLHQNFPNPFDFQTTIKYNLKNAGQVNIKILNVDGKEVATVFEGFQLEGEHQLDWTSLNLPNGIYFYRLQTEDVIITKKWVIKK